MSTRRLAAILAADVVGYSRLMGADEEGTLERLKEHRCKLIDPKITEHRGRIVKTTGDGMLVEFASAVDAVRCAVEVQRDMAERSVGLPQDKRIEIRVGIHVGDIIIDSDDIFGDGVNIAARLEGIAEPGGITISGAVHEQVRDRLPYAFDDHGEQTMKNIARPVKVYRVRADGSGTASPIARPPTADVPLTLPDKPSIAVLAFQNMSGDPEQEYFADGIAEDIITELSRFKSLFVIARNSSFTYKGRSVDVKQVGRELGVRYVLEGSVRRSGPRVRVSAQLIDAFSGEHIWSERYDPTAGEIFAVQDELTRKIVAVLPGRVESAEQAHAGRRTSQSLEAHDLLLRAKFLHHFVSPDANAEAEACLDRAIEKDPTFAAALAWKACTMGQAWNREFQPRDPKRFVEINQLVRRAVELDDNDAECHRIMCRIALMQRQYEKSEHHLGRALGLTPNDPRLVVQRGINSTYLGDAPAALSWIEQAMRIDPFSASHYETDWVRALYASGRPSEAKAVLQRVVRNDYVHHLWLATCSVEVGQEEQGRDEVQKALAMRPALTISSVMAEQPWKRSEDVERIEAALLRARLPR